MDDLSTPLPKLIYRAPPTTVLKTGLTTRNSAKDETTVGYLVQIDEFMQKLVGSLETEVKPAAPKKEEDW
jgi:hypothetical protein